MKIKSLFAFCFFLAAANAFAQAPCGADAHRTEWHHRYAENQQQYDTRGQNVLYIPVSVHLVGNDAGLGYYSIAALLADFCRLNEDYRASNIQFFIEGDIHFINNDSFYQHNSPSEGADFMGVYNIPNTLNSYIVSSAAGYCGYNLRCDGVVIAQSCMSGHTWAHEIGHYFGLLHPFHGWGGQNYNFNQPTPDTINYLYPFACDDADIVVDTVPTELADGSNCAYAGDGICDTPADYLSYRWQCDGNNMSIQQQRDPAGVLFRSDGTNIMSYSFDGCQSVFSQGQTDLMRAYAVNQRPYLLYENNPYRDSVGVATNTYPAPNAVVQAGTITFSWSPVQGATHYFVQAGLGANMSPIVASMLTTDTFFTAAHNFIPAPPNIGYSWRVYAFNTGYTCAPPTANIRFNTTNAVGITGPAGQGSDQLRAYPTPVLTGSPLYVHVPGEAPALLRIISWEGALVMEKAVTGGVDVVLDLPILPSGVYVLDCSGVGKVLFIVWQ